MKKRNKKERTWLLLGIMEEKVYYRYKGEQRQRQRPLGESRVDMSEPCEEGEGERCKPGAAARRTKVQKRVG